MAQEAVYKRAIDEENELDEEQQSLLPTAPHDPFHAFLNSKEEGGMPFSPGGLILNIKPTNICNEYVSVTSSPPTPFVGRHSQSPFPTSQSTPPQALPVLSAQERERIVRPFSPVYTKTSFSFRGQNPLIIPTASATQPEHHSSTTKRLLWECSNLHSVTLSRLLFSKLLCPTYRCTRED